MSLSPFWKTMPSGLAFDFENPQPEMVALSDIVHCLARTNRWGGNLAPFTYSVAQHSVLTARACERQTARVHALLHDAAEAYIGDLPTPFKLWLNHHGVDIVGLERRILYGAIYPALGLAEPSAEDAADVDRADQIALATEYRDVVQGHNDGWTPKAPPLDAPVSPLPPERAEDLYIYRIYRAMRDIRRLA